jgi:biopolymer transport protein ExbD
MRRFSQRSHLVTLSEINITPLLDLAFVLLIIFVITTPLLEKGLELKLPKGAGSPDRPINKNDIRTVEIDARGTYALNKRVMKLDQMVALLAQDFAVNPNLVIHVRADKNSTMEYYVPLMEACTKRGMTRISIRTEPPGSR